MKCFKMILSLYQLFTKNNLAGRNFLFCNPNSKSHEAVSFDINNAVSVIDGGSFASNSRLFHKGRGAEQEQYDQDDNC